MDMPTVLTTSGITALMQGIVYGLFRRMVERRDRLIDRLEEEVREMREKQIGSLARDIDSAREGRARLHRQIEAELVTEERCRERRAHLERKTDRIDDILPRLERVSVRTDEAMERAESVAMQQYNLAREMAAATERLRDLTGGKSRDGK
jgi:chromosome segregation ATPase